MKLLREFDTIIKKISFTFKENFMELLRPIHTCGVCCVVTTSCDLETTCGQIEHIKINYDTSTRSDHTQMDCS